jgi:hypothetical protein
MSGQKWTDVASFYFNGVLPQLLVRYPVDTSVGATFGLALHFIVRIIKPALTGVSNVIDTNAVSPFAGITIGVAAAILAMIVRGRHLNIPPMKDEDEERVKYIVKARRLRLVPEEDVRRMFLDWYAEKYETTQRRARC